MGKLQVLAVGTVWLTVAAIWLVASGNAVAQNELKKAEEQDPKSDKAEPKDRPLAKFMRGKLTAANLVLEGIATEDFDLVEKGAVQLQVISKAEKWRVTEDPLYGHHSDEFQRIIKRLQKHAEEKSLDGVSLSYVQMTMSCVECHRFVRNELIAVQ